MKTSRRMKEMMMRSILSLFVARPRGTITSSVENLHSHFMFRLCKELP